MAQYEHCPTGLTAQYPSPTNHGPFIQNIYFVHPPLGNAAATHAAHHPTTRISEEPIYFYDSDKPYFELAKKLS